MTAFYIRVPVTGAIQHFLPIDGTPHKVIFQATDVRKEKTGVHAKVTIALGYQSNVTVLAESTFNVGREEDRIRLGNHALSEPLWAPPKAPRSTAAARKPVEGVVSTNPLHALNTRVEPFLNHELLLFCRGLWEFQLDEVVAEERGGSEERTAASYILEPYILEDGSTIAFGPPGAGKSWIAYLWAILIDAGMAWPWPVKQAKVLIINLERSVKSVDDRVGDINEALGLPRDRKILRIDRRGSTLVNVFEQARRAVKKYGVGLVVLDSLSRAGVGNMNGNEEMNAAMDLLNSLGCAWLVLGHTSREDGSHLFGSQMSDAAADLMVRIHSAKSQIMGADGQVHTTLGIGPAGTKANDVPLPPLTIQRLEFDKKGLVAIAKAEPGEFLDIENNARSTDPTDAIRKYLLGVGAADIATMSKDLEVPKRALASALARRAEFRIVRRNEEGTVFYGVQELKVAAEDPGVPDYSPADPDFEQPSFDEFTQDYAI